MTAVTERPSQSPGQVGESKEMKQRPEVAGTPLHTGRGGCSAGRAATLPPEPPLRAPSEPPPHGSPAVAALGLSGPWARLACPPRRTITEPIKHPFETPGTSADTQIGVG